MGGLNPVTATMIFDRESLTGSTMNSLPNGAGQRSGKVLLPGRLGSHHRHWWKQPVRSMQTQHVTGDMREAWSINLLPLVCGMVHSLNVKPLTVCFSSKCFVITVKGFYELQPLQSRRPRARILAASFVDSEGQSRAAMNSSFVCLLLKRILLCDPNAS